MREQGPALNFSSTIIILGQRSHLYYSD